MKKLWIINKWSHVTFENIFKIYRFSHVNKAKRHSVSTAEFYQFPFWFMNRNTYVFLSGAFPKTISFSVWGEQRATTQVECNLFSRKCKKKKKTRQKMSFFKPGKFLLFWMCSVLRAYDSYSVASLTLISA